MSNTVTSGAQSVSIPLHQPSYKEKIFFFFSGMLSSVPLTLFFDQLANSLLAPLPDLYAGLFSVVLLAPFLEEFSKAFPLFYRHGETGESIFVLGLLIGLGFGVFEFSTYVFVTGAPILSRLSGIIFHATGTSITAYGVATKRTALFYLLAVVLHSSHNFFAFISGLSLDNPVGVNYWSIGQLIPTVTAVLCSWYLYKRISKKNRSVTEIPHTELSDRVTFEPNIQNP